MMTGSVRWRTCGVCPVIVLFAAVAIAWGSNAGAQGGAPPAAAQAEAGAQADADPVPRYRGFADMAGQLADQLTRIDGRLPGGPIPGLIGKNSFIGAHVEMLQESRDVLAEGAEVAAERLAAHERAVLTFLDRATQISRLLNDLEKAETEANQPAAAALREEIAALATGHLFAALAANEPARLVIVVEGQQDGSTYWPQTIHRSGLRVENRGAKRARGVTVRLVPVNSAVADIVAEGADCGRDPGDAAWTCSIETIEAGKAWPISVTFRHQAPETVGAGPPVAVQVDIELSARKPGLSAMPARIAFSVANCSANYHAALGVLSAAEADGLLGAMKDAARGDRKLPGRWLTPRVDWRDPEIRDLLARASRIMSRRGAEPWLAAAVDGQSVSRVVYGLRRYLRQDYYAALCTGGQAVAAAYRQFLSEFESRRQPVFDDRQMAHRLAAEAIDLLSEARARREGAAAPAAAGEPLPLSGLIDRVAELVGVELPAGGDAPPTGDAGADFDAIATLGSANLAARLDNDELTAARRALALIEAAFYFGAADRRYQTLERAFNAVLGGIANAHAANCGCRTSTLEVVPADVAVPTPGIAPPPPVPDAGAAPAKPPRAKPRAGASPDAP